MACQGGARGEDGGVFRFFIFGWSAIAVMAAPRTGMPPIPEELRAEAAPFLKIGAQRFFGWHPVERKILVGAPDANATQLFVIERPMAAARQLTFGPGSVSEAAFQPQTGRQILFMREVVDGQVFRIHPEVNWPVPILLSDGLRPYASARWAPNGQQVAYIARSRGADGLGLGILNPMAPLTARRLSPLRGGDWAIEHWARNSALLLLRETVSGTESYLHLADAGTGTLSAITPRDGSKVARGAARFAPGLDTVFYTSDRESEFQQLCRLDLRTGVHEVLLPELKWDVEMLSVSPSGKQLALVINEAGFGGLRLLDLKTMKLSGPAKLPRGRVRDLRWRANGTELGFSVSAADSAGDVFSLDTLGGGLTRWTRRAAAAHATPNVGTVRSFDGESVPLVYWLPDARRFAEPSRRPVLVILPGAPGDQSRPGHLGANTFLLEKLGVVIVRPNLRGAGGYGNRHRQLDNGRGRMHTLADLNAVLNWIRRQPRLDGERVALWGKGHGGSLTLLAMAEFNAFIRCGVAEEPVTNLVTHLRAAPAEWRERLRAEFGDERDEKMREFLDRISPLDEAGKNLSAVPNASPVLLLGATKPLCDAMREKKKSVWIFKPGELSGMAEKRQRFMSAALFLKKNLFRAPPP